MTTDQRTRIEQLFEKALALPAEERTAFLATTCSGDPATAAEVESLLRHDQQAPADFLSPPEPDPLAADGDIPDPLIGKTVGQYVVKTVIASGGMGTVYEAEQKSPCRTVALKVMRAWASVGSAARRFGYESQILARLTHPNIAQVYEAGSIKDGKTQLPFFAMEYVPGARSITAYADQEALTLRERLDLFVAVCEAVQHGHQKGIIHRDLKPGNILVDGAGHVKVIDFGVARVTDSDAAVTTMQTDVGQLVGTLQYMSPEQCEADPLGLDTRSDVYALGVVLYELVCGQVPYEVGRSSIHTAVRVICDGVPTRPSTIDRKLRGDLELIVLKALEKDRERRYGSAADLAADLRRYLDRQPISARRPTVITSVLRWAYRHPIAATASVCLSIAALVVFATIIGIWLVNARPHAVWLSDDHGEARLLSMDGRILKNWTAVPPGRIHSAELVKRPEHLGGGRLVLMAWASHPGDRWSGQLCAFDVDRSLDEPAWTYQVATERLPPDLVARGYMGEQFSAEVWVVEDIFPEVHGPEVVASYKHSTYSACMLTILSLSGDVLYQVWQDGGFRSVYWMSDPRLLVLQGLNADTYWDGRGYPNIEYPYPRVLFAIRPELGFVSSEYLKSGPGDDPLSPVWYRCLLPAEITPLIGEISLLPSKPPYHPDRNVLLALQLRDHEGRAVLGLSWTLDEFGHEVPEGHVVTDAFKRARARDPDNTPDPDSIYLGKLPPIVKKQSDSAGRRD